MTQEEYEALQAELAAWKAGGQPQRGSGMSAAEEASIAALGIGGTGLGAYALYNSLNKGQQPQPGVDPAPRRSIIPSGSLNSQLREMGVEPVPRMSISSIIPGTAANQDRRAAKTAGRDLVANSVGVREGSKQAEEARRVALEALDSDIAMETDNIRRNEAIINDPKTKAVARQDAVRARDAAQAALNDYQANGRTKIEADAARRAGPRADDMDQLTRDYEKAIGAPGKARAQAEIARTKKVAGLKRGARNVALTGAAVAFYPLVSYLAERKARGDTAGDGWSAAVNTAMSGGELTPEQVTMLRESMDSEAFENLLDLNSAAAEDISIVDEVDRAVEAELAQPRDQDVNLDQLAAEAQMLEDNGDATGAAAARERMTQLIIEQDAAGAPQATVDPAPVPEASAARMYDASMNDGSVGPTMENAAALPSVILSDVEGLERIAAKYYEDGDMKRFKEVSDRIADLRASEQVDADDSKYNTEIERGMAAAYGGDGNAIERMMYRMNSGQPTFGEDTPMTRYTEGLDNLDESLDVNIGDFLGEKGAPPWLQGLTNFSEDAGRGLVKGLIDPRTYTEGPNDMMREAYKGMRSMGMNRPSAAGGPEEQAYYSDEAIAQQEREAQRSAADDAAFNAQGRERMPMIEDQTLGQGDINYGNLTFQDLLEYRDKGILGGDPVQIAQDMGIEIPPSANGPYMAPVDTLDTLGDNDGMGDPWSDEISEYMRRTNQPGPMGQGQMPDEFGFRPEERTQYPAMDVDQPMGPEFSVESGGPSAAMDGSMFDRENPDYPWGGGPDNLPDVDDDAPDPLPKIRQFYAGQDEALSPRGQDPIKKPDDPFSDGGLNSVGLNSDGTLNPDRNYALAEPYTPRVDEFARQTPAADSGLQSGRDPGSNGPTTAERAPEANGPVGDFKASKGLAEDAADADTELNWINRQLSERFGMDADKRSDFARALMAFGGTMANTDGNFMQGFTQAGMAGMDAYDQSNDKRTAAELAAEERAYEIQQDSLDRQREQAQDQRQAGLDEIAARRQVAQDKRQALMDKLDISNSALEQEKIRAEIAKLNRAEVATDSELPSSVREILWHAERLQAQNIDLSRDDALQQATDLVEKAKAKYPWETE